MGPFQQLLAHIWKIYFCKMEMITNNDLTRSICELESVIFLKGPEFHKKLICTIIRELVWLFAHNPASNIDKDPYEVKCRIRAQCVCVGGSGVLRTGAISKFTTWQRHNQHLGWKKTFDGRQTLIKIQSLPKPIIKAKSSMTPNINVAPYKNYGSDGLPCRTKDGKILNKLGLSCAKLKLATHQFFWSLPTLRLSTLLIFSY